MQENIPQGTSTGQILPWLLTLLFGGGGAVTIIVAWINGWFSKPKVAAEAEGQKLQNEAVRRTIQKEGTTAAEYFSNKVDALLKQLEKANEDRRLAEADRDAQILVVKVREQEIERYRGNTATILINQGRAQADADRYRDDLNRANERITELEAAQSNEQHRQLTKTLLRQAGTETNADNDSGLSDDTASGGSGVRNES